MVGYLGGIKAVPFQVFDKLAHRNSKKNRGNEATRYFILELHYQMC
jgi:hypothetical protein